MTNLFDKISIAMKSLPARIVTSPATWLWLLSMVGAIISALSMTGLCSSACARAHQFYLFGVPPGFVGCIIFCAFAWLAFGNTRFACRARHLVIALALGAEIWLLWVQKTIIKGFCPLCVAIFFIWAALAIVEYVFRHRTGLGDAKRYLALLVAMQVGIFIGAWGLHDTMPPQPATASTPTTPVEDPSGIWFGEENGSKVDILVVSDWLCPACHATEPARLALAKNLPTGTRMTFVDVAWHLGSSTLAEASAALLLDDKENYLRARKVLADLSQTRPPHSMKTIFSALTKEEVDHPTRINFGYAAWTSAIVNRYGVNLTPSVIVRNSKNPSNYKLLSGTESVTAGSIQAAVKAVQ